MCEDYAIDAGLFSLEHTWSCKDNISERGRYLTVPKVSGLYHKNKAGHHLNPLKIKIEGL